MMIHFVFFIKYYFTLAVEIKKKKKKNMLKSFFILDNVRKIEFKEKNIYLENLKRLLFAY